jgi:hypothetical protein
VLSRHAQRPNWSGAAGLLAGVAAGFVVDLQLDALRGASASHNLLPFEVVLSLHRSSSRGGHTGGQGSCTTETGQGCLTSA